MAHSFACILVHVVFSTKDRAPDLTDVCREKLYPYMGGTARDVGAKALAVGGAADHVHLLLSLPTTRSVADAVRDLKANASRWIHETWPSRRAFAWQAGYGAFSVSLSSSQTVARYIRDQAEHHRRMTFQEEFSALLKRHGVAYDERYIWA
jgi:REP element-mobilizing transposase RayT